MNAQGPIFDSRKSDPGRVLCTILITVPGALLTSVIKFYWIGHRKTRYSCAHSKAVFTLNLRLRQTSRMGSMATNDGVHT